MGVKVRFVRSLLYVVPCTLAFQVQPASAQGEGVIRGQVVAAVDGSAIGHPSIALVSADGLQWRPVPADAAGRFVLGDVQPGEYRLRASADGFSARELRFVIEPREVRSVTVRLDVGPLALEVDVDAPLPGTHSPSSTVLTRERLDQLPIAQQQMLPDAIVTLAPGMIRGHDDFVHIRGHEVALNPLINGVSFWENPHTLFSGGLSAEVIETANVMTGGFAAEYGNRFGGVVDIVTKSGFTIRHSGAVTASAGQEGRRSVSGEAGGRRGRFGYYVFGSAFGSDRFLSPPAPEARHDGGLGGHGFARLDGDLGRAGVLRAVFMGDGASFEIPRSPSDIALRPLANAEQRTRQQTAIVGWSRPASSALFSGSLYQRWSRSRLLPADGPLTARARVERELLTVGVKADVSLAAARHVVKAGMDFVRLSPDEALGYDYAGYGDLTHLLGLPHIHVAGNAIDFSRRTSGGQLSGYVQDSIPLGDRGAVDVGVRLDHYDLVIAATHASPRVNTAFHIGRGSVLHASYNRFFIPPPIEGILSGSAGLTGAVREIGAALPALRPSVEDQFELGLTAPMRPIQAALTGYVRATDNPVHTTVWPDSRIYSYASFNRARAYGLEARIDAPSLAPYGITAYANYALGRVHFYNPVTGGFITEAAHVHDASRFPGPMDQTHTATGGVRYDHATSGTWLGVSFEYGSGTPIGHGDASHDQEAGEADHADVDGGASAVRVPGHLTANLSVGMNLLRDENRRARLVFRVDVENVGNDIYRVAQESQFSPTQFSVPRLISATMSVRF